jgi:hypothetical protein
VSLVTMTHPAIHTDPETPPATTTLEAYEKVWSDRGWLLTDGTVITVPAAQLGRARRTTVEG